jgi:hypothetical protein
MSLILLFLQYSFFIESFIPTKKSKCYNLNRWSISPMKHIYNEDHEVYVQADFLLCD